MTHFAFVVGCVLPPWRSENADASPVIPLRTGTAEGATVCSQNQHTGYPVNELKYVRWMAEHPKSDPDWTGFAECSNCGSSVHMSQLKGVAA